LKVLGIDTTTRCGSVGLVEEEQILSDVLLNIPVTHSERILDAIGLVLKQSGTKLEDLDAWAISLGPGSFTGLRIGASVVKGLSFATGKPVAGVPSLDVLSSQIAPTPYLICPILDARKGEVYTAFYRYQEDVLHRLTAYQALRPEDLLRKMEEKTIFVGDGVRTYGGFIRAAAPSLALFPTDCLHLPRGSAVARLGLERLREKERLDLSSFSPIYVRPSEAEIKWRERQSN
jgi:tRNA threonylcarbamoyladenosine biosynthesis protein TsaB